MSYLYNQTDILATGNDAVYPKENLRPRLTPKSKWIGKEDWNPLCQSVSDLWTAWRGAKGFGFELQTADPALNTVGWGSYLWMRDTGELYLHISPGVNRRLITTTAATDVQALTWTVANPPAINPAQGERANISVQANVNPWSITAGGYLGAKLVIQFTNTNGYTLTGKAANIKLAGGVFPLSGVVATKGSITSAAGPFNIANADTLIVRIDANADQTFTFNGVRGELTGAGGDFDNGGGNLNGSVLKLKVNGGAEVTVTFTAMAVDAASAAVEIDAATLAAGTPTTSSNSGGQVRIRSNRAGSGSSIEITQADADVGFALGTGSGSGDAVFLDAMTAAEVQTKLGAMMGQATVSVVGAAFKITSNSSGVSSIVLVQAASTADGKFTLDNLPHTGTDATLGVDVLSLQWDGTNWSELSRSMNQS